MSADTSSNTTTITEHEMGQVERANASGLTPVMFVHGLFLLPASWDRWADLFEAAGYAALTPGWPDDPDTVAEAKAHPGVSAAYPAASNRSAHRSQLLGSRNRPWMNITGVSPEAFARSTCPLSGSVIVVVLLDVVADMKVPPKLRYAATGSDAASNEASGIRAVRSRAAACVSVPSWHGGALG